MTRSTITRRNLKSIALTSALLLSSAVLSCASTTTTTTSPSAHRASRKTTKKSSEQLKQKKLLREERRRAKYAAKRASSSSSSYETMQYTDLPPSPALPVQHASDVELTTTFSCGSIWTEATTCSTLCSGTGMDDECPSGEYCYAGISCPSTLVEEQQQQQQQQARRSSEPQHDQQVQFVCGTSYEDASFSALSSSSTAMLCPTGQSSECPANMACYARVPIPEVVVDEKVEITSFTEPLMRNSTQYNSSNSHSENSMGGYHYLGNDALFSASKVLGMFSSQGSSC